MDLSLIVFKLGYVNHDVTFDLIWILCLTYFSLFHCGKSQQCPFKGLKMNDYWVFGVFVYSMHWCHVSILKYTYLNQAFQPASGPNRHRVSYMFSLYTQRQDHQERTGLPIVKRSWSKQSGIHQLTHQPWLQEKQNSPHTFQGWCVIISAHLRTDTITTVTKNTWDSGSWTTCQQITADFLFLVI